MMRNRLTGVLIGLTIAAVASQGAVAQGAEAYGQDWHRSAFWGGEYANGFTVLADTTLQLRAVLDPAAEAGIACPVVAKATYHPWNLARVDSDNLSFVSFTRIEEMRVDKDVSATLYGETDQSEVTVKFKTGDTWSYLAYLGEGAFLMSYDGVVYTADQSLSDVSTSLTPEDQRRTDEWLRIDCMNNQWGWLLMADFAENPDLTAPNILGYGEAADVE